MWGWLFGIVCIVCFTVIVCKAIGTETKSDDINTKFIEVPAPGWTGMTPPENFESEITRVIPNPQEHRTN